MSTERGRGKFFSPDSGFENRINGRKSFGTGGSATGNAAARNVFSLLLGFPRQIDRTRSTLSPEDRDSFTSSTRNGIERRNREPLISQNFTKLVYVCIYIYIIVSALFTHPLLSHETNRIEAIWSISMTHRKPSSKTFLGKKVFCGVPPMTHPSRFVPSVRLVSIRGSARKSSRVLSKS